MKKTRIAGAVLVALLPLHRMAVAEVVTLAPTKDNTLYESATGSLSNGNGIQLFLGKTNTGRIRRALLSFDISGNIPAGSTISSVSLTLHMSKTISGNEPVALHRLLADWGEGTSNASGSEGAGAPAATGDATWLHTFYSTQRWARAGGDFAVTASAVQTVGGIGSYTWASTPQLVADVQTWLVTPSENFGWLLLGDEAGAATAKRFDSREDSTASNRPELTVTYTPPSSPPVITLLGDNPLTLELGIPYVEPGFTATDSEEGDITANVVVTGLVDHTVPGSYTLNYDVSDWNGNLAEQKTRIVNVAQTVPFEIVEIITSIPEDMVQLTWSSFPGVSYGVWSRSDLTDGQWMVEATIVSDDESTSWTDSDTTPLRKFYRIEIK